MISCFKSIFNTTLFLHSASPRGYPQIKKFSILYSFLHTVVVQQQIITIEQVKEQMKEQGKNQRRTKKRREEIMDGRVRC